MLTFQAVYDLVAQIPEGMVTTYGTLAKLTGSPRAARFVGFAMREAPNTLPCQRVVRADGSLTDAFDPFGKETQKMLLEMEGVPFLSNGHVDVKQCLWLGPTENGG